MRQIHTILLVSTLTVQLVFRDLASSIALVCITCLYLFTEWKLDLKKEEDETTKTKLKSIEDRLNALLIRDNFRI